MMLSDALKIYLDATEEERARRRYRDRVRRGEPVDFESVWQEIRQRDQIDSSRSVAPLKQADDAVYIDSTQLSVEQVVQRILELVEEKARAMIG